MKKISERSIISMCTSLLLAISLTIFALLLCVKVGFTTETSIVKIMDKVNYYGDAYDALMDDCETLAIPYGLNAQVYDGIFTEETFKWDGHKYLKAGLNASTYTCTSEIYKSQLTEHVNSYVKENNLSVNGSQDEIINEFVEKSMEEYLEAVKIPYISTIGIFYRAVNKVFWPVEIIMLIFSALLIWVLAKQNSYKKNRIFRYIAYSSTSAFISIVIIPSIILFTKTYKKIQIYPEYLYNFISSYIKNGLIVMISLGIALFVISAIMIAVSCYIKHCYIEESRRKHNNRVKENTLAK